MSNPPSSLSSPPMKTALSTAGLAVILFAGARSVAAQDVLDVAYGRGVHAYFAGQNELALRWLDEAINAGSKDPRVHYFHGLALIAQAGGTIEAGIPDFEEAANLEISSGRVVNVGTALTRIQGYVRQEIENIRLQTFIENRDKLPRLPMVPTSPPAADAIIDPYGAGLTTGDPVPAPPPNIAVPVEPVTPEADPFRDDPVTPADPFNSNTAPPDAAPPADPFGGGTPPAAEPFGGGTPPAADPFGGTTPPPSTDDPFGAGANPFGN